MFAASIAVVWPGPSYGGRDLDHVVAAEVDPGERAQQHERLVRQQPGDLGRPGARRERRVDHVDVERQERRPVSEPPADTVAVVARADRAQLVALDQLEAHLARVAEVALRVQRPAHAREQRSLRRDHALLDRAPERRAVEVLLAVVLVPGVRVRVEQNHADRLSGGGGVRAQLAQDDRVVAAQHERDRARGQHRREAVGDLRAVRSALPGVMTRSPVVDDVQRAEHVDRHRRVVRPQQGRARADRLRPEARTRPVGRRGVERHADDGHVHSLQLARVGQPRERADPRVAGDAHGSITTLIVRSFRSAAPRSIPPCSSVCWTYSIVGAVRRSPGRTFGTPGG